MPRKRSQPVVWLAVTALAAALFATGCKVPPRNDDTQADRFANSPIPGGLASTRAIDTFEDNLANLSVLIPNAPGQEVFFSQSRQSIYEARWQAVQRAVAHHGTTHREAFYGSRAYWHTDSTRGIGWALDQPGDLNEPFYIDGKGNVRVAGDANADIEASANAIVHILGDLNATLELKGVCEVIIAGNLTKNATIICDGQLELFVGGNSAGVFGATGTATIVIDGNASGIIQCGAPATTLTITGDLTAAIPAPNGKDATLALRVDGYAPTSAMLDFASAGFTRVNATIGRSNVPPGLYPQGQDATRPTVRWVVLLQKSNDQ